MQIFGAIHGLISHMQAVVESTRNARKLYEKCGMKTTIPTMAIDVDKKFASWSKPDILFLRQWA